MFVVMALVTTFATTPLTLAFYPPWYQKKLAAWKRGEIDWDTGAPLGDSGSTRDSLTYEKLESVKIHRVLVYLRLDNMPAILTFMSLFGSQQAAAQKSHPLHQTSADHESAESSLASENTKKPVTAHGVRLLGLTERDSSVMKVSEIDEYSLHDPVVNTFRTFGALHRVAVSGEVSVLPESSFSDALVNRAAEASSDLILLPWSETGSMSESPVATAADVESKLSSQYVSFVQGAFEHAGASVAVFINKNFGFTERRPKLTRNQSRLSIRSTHENPTAPLKDLSHHIYLAFFGGADDRAALRFVLQLAENTDVTATIIHFETPPQYFGSADASPASSSTLANPVAKNGEVTATTQSISSPAERDSAFFASLKNSLPAGLASRVVFDTVTTETPVAAALEHGATELGRDPKNAGNLMVVGRNDGFRPAFSKEKVNGRSSDESSNAVKCLGVIGERAAKANLAGSVLVFQGRSRMD